MKLLGGRGRRGGVALRRVPSSVPASCLRCPKRMLGARNSAGSCFPGTRSHHHPWKIRELEDVKVRRHFPGMKVRVICTDPDATESSSDDEEGFAPRRLVREIYLPPRFSFSSSDSEDQDEETSCLSVLTTQFFPEDVSVDLTPRKRPKNGCRKSLLGKIQNGKLSMKPVKRWNCDGYKKSARCQLPGFKSRNYRSGHHWRWGKWAAGFRDPTRVSGYGWAFMTLPTRGPETLMKPVGRSAVPLPMRISPAGRAHLTHLVDSSHPKSSPFELDGRVETSAGVYPPRSSLQGPLRAPSDEDSLFDSSVSKGLSGIACASMTSMSVEQVFSPERSEVEGAINDTGSSSSVKSEEAAGVCSLSSGMAATEDCLLTNSSSSVLGTAVFDDCDSLPLSLSGDSPKDPLNKGAIKPAFSEMIIVTENFVAEKSMYGASLGCEETNSFQGVVPDEGGHFVNEGGVTSMPVLDDVTSFLAECGYAFSKSSEPGKDMANLLNSFDLLEDGSDFVDMSFDFDTEALSWINTSEAYEV